MLSILFSNAGKLGAVYLVDQGRKECLYCTDLLSVETIEMGESCGGLLMIEIVLWSGQSLCSHFVAVVSLRRLKEKPETTRAAALRSQKLLKCRV